MFGQILKNTGNLFIFRYNFIIYLVTNIVTYINIVQSAIKRAVVL